MGPQKMLVSNWWLEFFPKKFWKHLKFESLSVDFPLWYIHYRYMRCESKVLFRWSGLCVENEEEVKLLDVRSLGV